MQVFNLILVTCTHYEAPYRWGDTTEYPFTFIDTKSDMVLVSEKPGIYEIYRESNSASGKDSFRMLLSRLFVKSAR